MSDKQGTSASRKRKRIKLKCLVSGCNQTFDDDYRASHNKKYHEDLLKRSRSIEVFGAPKNPFSMFKSIQQKQQEYSGSSASEAAAVPAVGS